MDTLEIKLYQLDSCTDYFLKKSKSMLIMQIWFLAKHVER